MASLEIPWALDLLHNPEARADWERRHPGRATEMQERFPLGSRDQTEGLVAMAKTTKEENEWLDKATAAAVASAKKMVATINGPSGIAGTKQVGALSDTDWGIIATSMIFGWIRVRVQQAIAEGISQEEAVRSTGLSPSPGDVAVIASILPTLADTAAIDWKLPLAAWSKDVMTNFLLLAWQLIDQAEAARDHGPGRIIGKSEDWATKGDDISDIPFDQ
jgi:hypothetical protein